MLFDFFIRKKAPAKLPFHTDIHCHIVPGVDDGSPDAETSVKLLEHMHDWGIDRVFASPHSTQDTFENTPAALAGPFRELTEAVEKAKLPVELHMHTENRIDDFFLQQLEKNDLLVLPKNFILLENSFSVEPWDLNRLIFDVGVKGLVPILAHPERYRYYNGHHRDRYFELADSGLMFQINLLSLAGHYGKRERETALFLLKNRLVQFIGTDLHRASHVESIERYLHSHAFKSDLKLLDNLQNDTL